MNKTILKLVVFLVLAIVSFDATAQTKKTEHKQRKKTARTSKAADELVDKKMWIPLEDSNIGTVNIDDLYHRRASPVADEEDRPFVAVEQMPAYPGGDGEMYKFIGANLKYPAEAQQSGIQGRVTVRFVIEKDGSITHAQIVRSVDPALDKEALRVISLMPKWNAGKQDGMIVRVYYTLPIVFKL